MKKTILLATTVLFLTAFSASAQTGTWTAVGSTGTVDPTQVGLFGVFNGTRLGFNPAGGSASQIIVARFNVTNTYGGSIDDTPGWTTLEVGAVNSSFNPVTARLYRVDPCTGNRILICTANNNFAGSTGQCANCTFASNTFDFANFLYYVEVSITRAVGTGNPQLSTLRIF